MTEDSAYWMNEVRVRAKALSLAKRIGGEMYVARRQRTYDVAVQKYTNPFYVEKGTTA